MTELEKKLLKRMLSKDEGIQPGVGTPFQTPLREDEGEYRREARDEAGTEFSVSSQAPLPPAPAPAPAVGAAPMSGNPAARVDEARRFEEEDYSTRTGTSTRYNPETADPGTPLNPPAGRATKLEEEDDEANEAFKALSGLFRAITSKYVDARNPSATVHMQKEFDDAIKQVFAPKSGTENFTSLRSPGQPPAKFAVQPGNSGQNVRGRNPDIRSSPETYPQAYQNPKSPGSGYSWENSDENYGNRQLGTGETNKPSRDPNVRSSNPYHSQRGAEAPSHPETERTVPSALYDRGTYITSRDAQTQNFAKAATSLGLHRTELPVTLITRHGEREQNYIDRKSTAPNSGTEEDFKPDEATILLRKHLHTVIAQDSPYKAEADGFYGDPLTTQENVDTVIEKAKLGDPAARLLEERIVIKLAKQNKLSVPKDE